MDAEDGHGQTKPVFKETLWEWRSFDRLDLNTYNNISGLPLKTGKSTKILDRYLCKADCEVNIKLRGKDLKLKFLLSKTDTGIEQWTTEVYNFPISANIFRNLTGALKMDIGGRVVEDGKRLLSLLSHASKSIKVISVHKQRELYMWPPRSKDAVTIELAEISKPEHVMTVSIEHHSLEKVAEALKCLHPISASIKTLNYVDCLKVWLKQGRLFG